MIKNYIQGLTFKKKAGAQPLSLDAWAASGKSMSGVCKKVDNNLWYHGNQYQVAVVKTKPVMVRNFNHNFWDALTLSDNSYWDWGVMQRFHEFSEEQVNEMKYFAKEESAAPAARSSKQRSSRRHGSASAPPLMSSNPPVNVAD